MADTSVLTWPFFDDHHRTLASDLTAWCEAELTAPHDAHDIDGQCRNLLERLARGGWLRFEVPVAYGGVLPALDVPSLSLIRETLARYPGVADFDFAMQGLVSRPSTLFGSD